MRDVDLVADTDVVSYMFKGGALGTMFSDLVGTSSTGITLQSLAELHYWAARNNWGYRRIASLDAFMGRFLLLDADSEIANISGAIRASCDQVGRAISWPDAWVAATALWLGVPLVAHDRDLERIPGLRVLTVHKNWQIREEGLAPVRNGTLWLGESSAEAAALSGIDVVRYGVATN
jgi:predicted nucleic acid-binding protein